MITCLSFVTGDPPCSLGVPVYSRDWEEEGKLVGREGGLESFRGVVEQGYW